MAPMMRSVRLMRPVRLVGPVRLVRLVGLMRLIRGVRLVRGWRRGIRLVRGRPVRAMRLLRGRPVRISRLVRNAGRIRLIGLTGPVRIIGFVRLVRLVRRSRPGAAWRPGLARFSFQVGLIQGCRRKAAGAAAACESARKRLIPRQEWQCARATHRLEHGLSDPPRIGHAAGLRCNDTVAFALQLPASIAAAESCRAVQQNNGGDPVRSDIEVEGSAPNADRSGGCHNLVGRGSRISADPAERSLCGFDRQLLHRIRVRRR